MFVTDRSSGNNRRCRAPAFNANSAEHIIDRNSSHSNHQGATSDVSRCACQNSSRSAGVHHGANRRSRNLRGAGTPHQPPRALSSQPRAQAPRSLCHLHGEQRPLYRKLRRGRALGTLLHLRQFVSDRRRARLHHQQQRIKNSTYIRRDSRDCPRRNWSVPQGRSRTGGERPGRRRPTDAVPRTGTRPAGGSTARW